MIGGTRKRITAAGRATATRCETPRRCSSQPLTAASYPRRSAAKTTTPGRANRQSATTARGKSERIGDSCTGVVGWYPSSDVYIQRESNQLKQCCTAPIKLRIDTCVTAIGG